MIFPKICWWRTWPKQSILTAVHISGKLTKRREWPWDVQICMENLHNRLGLHPLWPCPLRVINKLSAPHVTIYINIPIIYPYIHTIIYINNTSIYTQCCVTPVFEPTENRCEKPLKQLPWGVHFLLRGACALCSHGSRGAWNVKTGVGDGNDGIAIFCHWESLWTNIRNQEKEATRCYNMLWFLK